VLSTALYIAPTYIEGERELCVYEPKEMREFTYVLTVCPAIYRLLTEVRVQQSIFAIKQKNNVL
jgi:hypothetical protein